MPPENHLAGIFQYHQAVALRDAGFHVGALSIRQAYSIPMILRAATSRLAGKRVTNALGRRSLGQVGKLLIDKIARPARFVEHDEIDGIPVIRIEGFFYSRPSPRTNHFGWIRAGHVAFDEYCRRHGGPDVIHAHNLDAAGLLALQLSRRTGIPFVITEHSTFFERNLVPHGLYPRLRRAAREARAFAVVSPSLANVLHRELGLDMARMRWIPNIIDSLLTTAPAAAERSESAGFRFLCIGNLIPLKNHAILLRAFDRAFSGQGSVTLRIGGDGPLDDELRQLITDLGLSSQVELIGRLSREQVIDELDRSDAVVLPSDYETFGVVLIEALARGKPVVSTASGGPESFVTEGDGLLVPVGDVAQLAEALTRLRDSRDKYSATDIRSRALARFGPERITAQLEELYTDALVQHS